MKRKRCGTAAAALLASVCTNAAHADLYAGGGILSSEYQYEDVGHGTGYRGFVGWRADELPLFLEVGQVDFGDVDVDSVPGISIGFSGVQVALGYLFRATPASDSGFFVRGGYYDGDASIEDDTVSVESSSSGGFLSGGFDWLFARHAGLRFDLEVFMDVKDYAGFQEDHESNVTVASLSLFLNLPTGESTAKRAAADFRALANAATAPPPAAPLPATAQGQSIRVMPGAITLRGAATVRGQPRADGTPIAQLQVGDTVVKRSSMTNAAGDWWYVDTERGSGWLSAAALN